MTSLVSEYSDAILVKLLRHASTSVFRSSTARFLPSATLSQHLTFSIRLDLQKRRLNVVVGVGKPWWWVFRWIRVELRDWRLEVGGWRLDIGAFDLRVCSREIDKEF